uniref:Uncharacterized protein n=1 Tax=Helianthus annuus TaxID=4232 RepID=A0A251SDC7_HELAN
MQLPDLVLVIGAIILYAYFNKDMVHHISQRWIRWRESDTKRPNNEKLTKTQTVETRQ